MILQELTKYYYRLHNDPDADVPPFGFGKQGVHFCIVLNEHGQIVGDPIDLRGEKGKAKRIEVPGPIKKTSGIAANFLWENTSYALGHAPADKGKRTPEEHATFIQLAKTVLKGVTIPEAKALLAFLNSWRPEEASHFPLLEEMEGKYIVFRLEKKRAYIHEAPEIRQAWLTHLEANQPQTKGMCLVTGEKDTPIPKINAAIKGVTGAQTAGAALVSFNIDAATSFNKTQNLNAPISEQAAFAYTTALNYLLSPESTRKVRMNDTTLTFWTETPTKFEEVFWLSMDTPFAEDEMLKQQLHGYLGSIAKGKIPDEFGDPETPFYILGVSPNAARLSVRIWCVSTIQQLVDNLHRHYSAMQIVPAYASDPRFPTPKQLLRDIATNHDFKNIPPQLEGQLLKSILQGAPYPTSLLVATLGRIRVDKKVTYLRMCLIKAFLTRKTSQEIPMGLDATNTEIGYLLGRTFAVAEYVQAKAITNANATIRDKFFASASVNPSHTFPLILRHTQHGLAKIRKAGRKPLSKYLDVLLQNIIDEITSSEGFPKSLSLTKQGFFMLGYYHQRQDLYTVKETATEENTED